MTSSRDLAWGHPRRYTVSPVAPRTASNPRGHTARWLTGYPHLAPFLDQQAAVHRECASEVDIEAPEGTAFPTSACYPDQDMKWPLITAFEVTSRYGGSRPSS